MKIKLNKRQAYFLFIPILVGIFYVLSYKSINPNDQFGVAVPGFLMTLGVFTAISYQALLAVEFNKVSGIKAIWFNINALVPVAIFLWYLLYLIYHSLINPVHVRFDGPVKVATFKPQTIILYLLLFHAAANFFFINNRFVETQIKLMPDVSEQDKMIHEFLQPMKKAIIASVLVFVFILFAMVIIDIFRFAIV